MRRALQRLTVAATVAFGVLLGAPPLSVAQTATQPATQPAASQTAPAQTAPAGATSGTAVQTPPPGPAPTVKVGDTAVRIDFEAWEKDAATAEDVIGAARASSRAMEDLRLRIVSWRTKFEAAKSLNAPQIQTLKEQINALGAVPSDGTQEDPAIAERRRQLNEALSRAQAPGVASVEAFSRADGLIRQIDALIRERQADALLRLLPSPLNPLNWPSGLAVLTQGTKTLWTEVQGAWANPARQAELRDNVPVIVVLLAVAALLMARGSSFMERLSLRLQRRMTLRGRNVMATLVSLGQVIVPVGGMILLAGAIMVSGMTGPRLKAMVEALPLAAFCFFAARWLASWLFPSDERAATIRLTDRPKEAYLMANAIGLVTAVEQLREAFTTDVRPPLSLAAQSVWLAPLVVIVAIFVVRFGLLLRRQSPLSGEEADSILFRQRMVSVIGTVCVIVGVVSPVLALVGYVAAANALIWPMVYSLGLTGALILLQRFLTDIYIAVTKSGDEGREALVPVLIGFFLSLGALPSFALIWGARQADLSEAWARFQEGAVLGGVRISPVSILLLFIVFAIGYMLTRVTQGAIRSSLLPRTRLDKGAQNAVVAGLGYLGLILSGLAAVTVAGIDLSALAIVAGALSVGIGFGLQNIVQNFISGIILLIERPITEGDTIEVSGKTGVVRAISVRSTRISTGDQAEVVVPNAQFVSGIVTNFTRENLKTKLVIPVTVGYDADTREAEKILREIIEAQPLVVIKPPPTVALIGFSQRGIEFEIGAILSDMGFKLAVQSDVNHQILDRFRQAGIELPHDRLGSARQMAAETRRAVAAEGAQLAGQTSEDAGKNDDKARPEGKRGAIRPRDINNVPDDDVDPDRR